MASGTRQFQLATEAPFCDSKPPWQWKTAELKAFERFPLGGHLSDSEIGSLVAALCDPLDLAPQTATEQILEALASLDRFSLAGGLRITDGDKVIVSFGCCCGLEQWRELFSILEFQSPWMGHDPDPWCEFLENDIVRFWSSGSISGMQLAPSIEFSTQRVADELAALEASLHATLSRLHDWLSAIGSPHRDTISDTFGRSFSITTDSSPDNTLAEPREPSD